MQADINKDTWTIDPDDFERKITPKTKAVVAVHLLGIPCDMKRIVAIARRHGIKVVEDCAQALDCRIDGQHVGTFGDFGCFSFHAAKTMTTLGEGGMFVCSDDQVAHNVPGIRHNGLCAFQGERERYWVPAMSNVDEFLEDRWPQNFCLGEAQCALGSEQLESVIANNEILIEQDRKIREWLKDVPEITFPGIVEGGRYVVHQYIMHYDGSKYGKPQRPAGPADTEIRRTRHRAVLSAVSLPAVPEKGLRRVRLPGAGRLVGQQFLVPVVVRYRRREHAHHVRRPHPCGEGPARLSAGKNGTVP